MKGPREWLHNDYRVRIAVCHELRPQWFDFQTLQLKENGTYLPLHAGLQQPVSCSAEAILSKQVEDDKLIESLKSMLPSFAC